MDEEREKMERRWKRFQEHQGYTDEQMATFRSDPIKVKSMERAPMWVTHNIIAECVESNTCNCGHKVGDRIVFNGQGCLLTDQSPNSICAFALHSIAGHMCGLFDRIHENLSGDFVFWRVGCPDVGVDKGGWGHTEWKMYTEPVKRD